MTKFYNWLNEAGLGGMSRSGGMPNWDYYVVQNYPQIKNFEIDKDGSFLNNNLEFVDNISKNTEIELLSIDLKTKGNSKFAYIKRLDTNETGYVNINFIRKPTKKSGKSIIPGGTTSKEFTPDKLLLSGMEFSNKQEFIKFVWQKINSIYDDIRYDTIRLYIKECLENVGNTKILFESYSKNYKIENYNISDGDLKILSKNFGDAILGLYVLSTNKKAKKVGYPSDISQQLYDFYMINERNQNHFYSVKASSGSSTSIENINFVLKFINDHNNSFYQKYKDEIDVIKTLMNNKKEGITTIKNIYSFFKRHLPQKTGQIINELNKLTPENKIRNISQKELTKWIEYVRINKSLSDFQKTMLNVYKNILSDFKNMKGTSKDVLKEIYESNNDFYNGYLYYPMGSYIVDYLNNYGDFNEVLNKILNMGSFITQIECNLSNTNVNINVKPFKKNKFRFSYNAGSKYPGNRPIGFISTK